MHAPASISSSSLRYAFYAMNLLSATPHQCSQLVLKASQLPTQYFTPGATQQRHSSANWISPSHVHVAPDSEISQKFVTPHNIPRTPSSDDCSLSPPNHLGSARIRLHPPQRAQMKQEMLSSSSSSGSDSEHESDREETHKLTINEHFAKAYEYRKEREELQKCAPFFSRLVI